MQFTPPSACRIPKVLVCFWVPISNIQYLCEQRRVVRISKWSAVQRNDRARLVEGLGCFLCRTPMWCATRISLIYTTVPTL